MLKTMLKHFIQVIAAAYIGLLVMCIVITPLRFMTYDPTVVSVVSSVCCVLASMVCLFFFCIKNGYRDDKSGQKTSIFKIMIAMCLAVAMYDLLTVIFRYYTGAATNVCYIAQILGDLSNTTDIKEMARMHGGLMFVSLLMQTIPFIPAMIGGYIYGGKKHRKSKKELTDRAKETEQ